MIKLSEM